MERVNITFDELRRIKHALPQGSMKRIAELLNTTPDAIRDYFGGDTFSEGTIDGIHYEQGGTEGGIVTFDDPTILQLALKILSENNIKH